MQQQAWIEQNAAAEDGNPSEPGQVDGDEPPPADPMQGLEGLDVAGPRQE